MVKHVRGPGNGTGTDTGTPEQKVGKNNFSKINFHYLAVFPVFSGNSLSGFLPQLIGDLGGDANSVRRRHHLFLHQLLAAGLAALANDCCFFATADLIEVNDWRISKYLSSSKASSITSVDEYNTT